MDSPYSYLTRPQQTTVTLIMVLDIEVLYINIW